MKGVIVAWLVGTGLMTYKDVKQNKRPPLPAELLAESGLFVVLGLLAEAQPKLAATLAWGFDLAAFLTLWEDNPITGKGKGKTAPKTTPKTKAK